MDVHGFDAYDNINKMSYSGTNLLIPSKSGAYAEIKNLDLTGVSELRLMAAAPKAQLNANGGKVELRLDSPTGKLLGESAFMEASEAVGFAPTPLKIPVNLPPSPDNKPHDVYLVFVNPEHPLGSLMVVMGVEAVLNSNDK